MASLDYFYGDYGEVEQAFLAAIDTSLQPRSKDRLYDVVGDEASLPGGGSIRLLPYRRRRVSACGSDRPPGRSQRPP
jgi:hypothetical protein